MSFDRPEHPHMSPFDLLESLTCNNHIDALRRRLDVELEAGNGDLAAEWAQILANAIKARNLILEARSLLNI